MAETQIHLDQIVYLLFALQQFFMAQPDVFVAADLLVYYVEGDPKRRVAPDVFVARGVADAKRFRTIYQTWVEGRMPEVVIEVTSRSSRREDTHGKQALYETLGVREYFLFDPLGDYLRPRLQGYRLVAGRYAPLAPAEDGSLRSEALGLELRLQPPHRPVARRRAGGPAPAMLRLYDPAAGRWLPGPEDEAAARREAAAALRAAETARQAAETAREAEAAARREAEAEIARLRALLDRRDE